ncbi:MAG TPA: carboxypeptidase-like regulatory domain-containing protein [Steroidobacteraceae bacterium]
MAAIHRLILMAFAAVALAGCHGGGGDGGGGSPPPTYSLSGSIANAFTGAAVANVSISITGSALANTSTNAMGQYSVSGLAPGNYAVTATLMGATFTPSMRPVTIIGAAATGEDFLAIRGGRIASGLQILPESFLSSDQLRASIVQGGGEVFFTDSTDQPLKKVSLSTGTVTPLATRFGSAESVFVRGQNVFWIDGGNLYETSLDGKTTTVLARGTRDLVAGVTADLVVDDTGVYWVNTVSSLSCSPSCTWIIQRVRFDGSAPVTVATANRRVVALSGDADHLYWEEASLEPLSAGCQCGSKVQSVAKTGGAALVLVDGTLNGNLPAAGPGYVQGSWYPAAGLAVTANAVLFVNSGSSYTMYSIPLAGGALTTVATVPTSAGDALNTIFGLSVVGTNAYWIDPYNHALYTVPVTGGSASTLATGIGAPTVTAAISLAVTATTAYWTEAGTYGGCCIQAGTGTLKSVALSGGSVSTLFAGLDAPVALTINGANAVWAESWRVAAAPLAGGAATTLASGISTSMARITVDASHVYVLDADFIKILPTSGGTVEKLAAARGDIADSSLVNQDIVVDATSVYWTVKGIVGGPTVQKVALTGGAPVILAVDTTLPNPQDCYWRIALDTQSVYWSAGSSSFPEGCRIMKAPLNGGATATLVDYAYLADFTVDGTNVYFSELSNPGTIQQLPVGGGAIMPFAGGVVGVIIAHDAEHIYWNDPRTATVLQLPKAGAASATPVVFQLASATDPQLALDGLSVDSNGLYCSEAQAGNIDVFF